MRDFYRVYLPGPRQSLGSFQTMAFKARGRRNRFGCGQDRQLDEYLDSQSVLRLRIANNARNFNVMPNLSIAVRKSSLRVSFLVAAIASFFSFVSEAKNFDTYRDFTLVLKASTGEILDQDIRVDKIYLTDSAKKKKTSTKFVSFHVIYPDMAAKDLYCAKRDCKQTGLRNLIIQVFLSKVSVKEEWGNIKDNILIKEHEVGNYKKYYTSKFVSNSPHYYLEFENGCCNSVAYFLCMPSPLRGGNCTAVSDYKDKYRIRFTFYRDDLDLIESLASEVPALLDEVMVETNKLKRSY